MPTKPLTAFALRSLKPRSRAYKVADGGGLYLLVNPSGSCLWRLAYRFAGKQRTLAIGVYPRIGLADARKAREAAKDLLADDRDPSAEKKQAKRATRIAGNSFEAVAREWLENERPKWKSNHYERLVRRLEQNVFLHMGKSSIDTIEPAELLDVLRKIEARGVSDIPGRVRQTCSQVFRYAVATGRAKRDPTFDLRGALKAPPRVKHRASIAADGLPTFMTRLARYNGDERTRLGIDFILRTMVRTTEARFARWPEFEELEGRSPLWRIPPGRMKIQREHLVPLAPQVVGLLNQLRPLSGKSDLVFVAPTNAGVLSENTFLFALYNLGYHGKATVHGFRGTASTILNENEFEPDWI
ncbi:MAG: integrase arm-type DNA-binding domain-containing protein, partial [Reyranella sp.]|nr:integrase arm-type DNA-binding domain-containing protein [Reyranella sp.]